MRRQAVAALAAACLALNAGPLLAQAAAPARVDGFAKLPYWPGYWVSEGQAGTTIGGFAPATLATREGEAPPTTAPVMALAGFGAPWSEEGKKLQAEARAKGPRKAMGWGYPMMMNAAAPLQFMITPEETLILNPYADVRHIYTDGRPMPPAEDLWPTVWGTSVGRWEGDTLVVETVQVKNPNIYFHGAPALSEQARYHERIRMDGNRLVDEITIEDPVALAQPWKTTLTFVRDIGFDRMIQIDFDNDRTVYDNGVQTIEAPADER